MGSLDRVGKVFEGIDDRLRDWMARQSLFFVGSAPLDAGGHVNLSPKGPIGSFAVLDPHTVAYLDVVGSGAETVAHLRENGRIVVMFCSFDGPPRILRLHGRGRVVDSRDPEFEDLVDRAAFEEPAVPESRRSVIVVDVTRVADACGYGVPLMDYRGRRPHMEKWAAKKVRMDALEDYVEEKNSESIDGLPAVEPAP